MNLETLDGGNIENEDAEDSEDVGWEGEADASAWQGRDGVTLAVLRAVFSRLEGSSLVRAASVCRAWRAAAAEPALWRRRLLPHAAPTHLRAFRRAAAAAQLHCESSWSGWSWRREYWLTAARWRLHERVPAAGGASVTHAALSHAADRIAVTADDASLTLWERVAAGGESRWARGWRASVRARGWAAAGVARWAPGDARLLLAGPLALADRWELLVLRFDQNGRGVTEVRAECSSCGGCWASADIFVTLIPRLLAPARAVTTVWLNAAEQRLHSEYAGVTVPVLRIYNEAATHITHVLVAEVPAEELEKLEQKNSTTLASESVEEYTLQEGEGCPAPEYWQATLPVRRERAAHVLVAALGAAGGERGVARALGAWALHALAPPPLCAAASLAERVARRRNRAAPPPHDEPLPSEEELRALCMPPLVTCRLQNRVLGLEIHPNGGCVWASTCVGAECISLPALRPLLRVSAATNEPVSTLPYVVQPAVSNDYIAAPAGDGSGLVRVWAARSGAAGAAPHDAPPHDAPAVAALLPARTPQLLVLAGDSLYEIPSRGRGACDALPQDSCERRTVPPCAPCEARAPPACRGPAHATLRGLRAACRPPPRANRPPCPTRQPPCALTCEHLHAQNILKSSSKNKVQCSTESPNSTSGRCGDTLDLVAQRISAAKLARRLDYEREVAERKKAIAPPPPPALYWLGAGRETVRATDGRDYIVLPQHPTAATDSNIQSQTNTAYVDLDPATSCDINRLPHVDPCAHHPRILLRIDRSDTNNSSSSHRVSSLPNSFFKPSRCTPTNNQLRSRDNSELSKKNYNKVTVPKKQCKGNDPKKLTDWCSSPPKMVPEPPRCRQPSLVERLRRRPKSSCGGVRKLHSAITNLAKYDNNKIYKHIISKAELQSVISQVIADKEKLNKMLSERNELKEVARGQTILEGRREKPTASGRLELHVPAGTHTVQVRVTLHPDSVPRLIQHVRCSHSDIESSQEGVCFSQNASPKQTRQNFNESRCKPRQISESSCERKQTKSNPSCETKQKPKACPCDLKPTPEPRRCSSTNELLPNTILLP